jgi:hypothetical protein
LILFPGICPLGSFQDETIHYLSWPAWEFFINPPTHTNMPTLDKLFPSLKRPKDSRCLIIGDPPNFLAALGSLRSAQTGVDLASVLEGFPFDPESEGNLKRQIRKGKPEKAQTPDRGYLILGLFSLAMMEEKEINSLIKDAEKRNREMLSQLMGSEETPKTPTAPNDSDNSVSFSNNSGKFFPDNLAEGIMKTWFRMASSVLQPNDRLWTDSEQFQELLMRRHIKVPNTSGQFFYDEHNL